MKKTNANFDELKRNFETKYVSGSEYSDELMDLATAIAYSVVNKCIDPQRKTAQVNGNISNSGVSPAMVALKRGIAHDRDALARLARCQQVATRSAYDGDGDQVVEILDRDAYDETGKLVDACLSDGMDLVQTAAVALIEAAAAHAEGSTGWLDAPYTVRRLSRRVYVRADDSAAYRDVMTTPIQDVYRAVRRTIQDNRAVQADPCNGYIYIDAMTPDGMDTIYYRSGKYMDLGGYDYNGNYTTDRQTVDDYNAIVAKLDLTDRQDTIIRLRMQGHGYKAIATYLGVTPRAARNAMAKVQAKANAIGFRP